MKRRCERVQARIPRLVEGSLPSWRQRLFERHLARCDDCSAEFERQLAVSEGLRSIGTAAKASTDEPPEELLDVILGNVNDPGLRGRAAVPLRGAVSGARPELSVAGFVLTAVFMYLLYRAVRAVVDRLEDDR